MIQVSSEIPSVSTITPQQDYTQGVNHTIDSDFTSNEYWIKVVLPYNYNISRVSGYPVVYFLDYGEMNRGGNIITLFDRFVDDSIFAINWTMIFENNWLPELIFVGILNPLLGSNRFESDVINNHADYKLFLEQELIPLIDQTYYVYPDERILIGYNGGGFFVLQDLFHYPNTAFTSFIAADGYLDRTPSSESSGDELYLVNAEQEMRNRIDNVKLPVNLFFASEARHYNTFSSTIKIAESIFKSEYKNFNIFTVFSIEDYAPLNMIFDGLFYIFYREMSARFITERRLDHLYNSSVDVNLRIYQPIQFLVTGSEANSSDVTYFWDFGDHTNSTIRSPVHQYTIADEYIVNMTMTNGLNETSSATRLTKILDFDKVWEATSLLPDRSGQYYKKKSDTDIDPYNVNEISEVLIKGVLGFAILTFILRKIKGIQLRCPPSGER